MQDDTKTLAAKPVPNASSSPRRSPFGLFGLAIVLLAASATYFATQDDRGTGSGELSTARVRSSFNDPFAIDPDLLSYRPAAQISVRFNQSRAIAVGPQRRIYVAGDQAIRVFASSGELWKTHELESAPTGLGVGGDDHVAPGRIYVVNENGVRVLAPEGHTLATWPAPNEDAILTSIAVGREDIFVSDAGNRLVWRFDPEGQQTGQIGPAPPHQAPSFVVTSSHFDLAVGSEGLIHVANPGRLQIATYTYEGDLGSVWGQANSSISGFFGCCNPAHFAPLPDGRFVTSEKGIPRIKVYDPTGRFESVVAGVEQLEVEGRSIVDPRTAGQHADFDVATDTEGRVLVLDPRKNVIRVFVPTDEPETRRGES